MKQVIRRGLKEMIVDEVPAPVAGPHHILVQPVYSLISSGTETASIHEHGALQAVAENPSYLGRILDVAKTAGPVATLRETMAKLSEYAALGYAGAGVIVEKHATVKDLELGDPVAYGGEGTGHAETIVTGRNLAVKIPPGVAFEHACFATLGSIAMNAVRVAGIGMGDVVAIIGLGLVGQLVAQLARLQGGVIIAIDLKPERMDLARRLGADHAVPGGSGALAAVLDITCGRGADCVIVAAAARSPAPARQALEICRERGRIVVVGAVELEFPWNDMYLKEIQLSMSRAYGPGSYDASYEKQGRDYPLPYVRWTENRNMEEFLRLLAAGKVEVQPLITHTYPLAEAPAAYRTILNPASGSLAVLLRYPDAPAAPGVKKIERRVAVTAEPLSKAGLQIALAGAGNIARWAHLPALKKARNAGLRAVFSTSGVRGKSYAKRFGASYCSTDYTEMLHDPEIDAVVIVTRNQHHGAQALEALRAGKHVFVEKPMALTEAECRELARAAADTRRQLAVGFNRRFAPYYLEMKKALSRRTGPAVIQCRMNSPGISGAYWMADPAIGGAILGEACHFVDLMYWLLESEPVLVAAFSLPTGREHPVGENNMVASFRFADGSIGNLTYCTVGSKTSAGERVEAYAQGLGAVSEDFTRLSVRQGMRRNYSRWWGEKGYDAQMAAFLASLRGGKLLTAGVRDGARATIGCLRMLESAKALEPRAIDLDAVLG